MIIGDGHRSQLFLRYQVESISLSSYAKYIDIHSRKPKGKSKSMQIAYFSPMPPERSGISDYSVELLEHLTKLVDVDIFTGVAKDTLYHNWTLHPYAAYTMEARRAPYQLNVYAMGNNYEFHDEIFELALREPGLVVMHDLTLYGFFSLGFGARRDLLEGEVRYAHGARALAEWRSVADNYMRVDRLKINLMRRIAERSRALVSHSKWGCDLLREIAPGVPVYHVPHGLSVRLPQTADQSHVRASLGIGDNAFVAGVFGHIEPEKRVLQVIEAFGDVVKEHPNARLLIAGRSANVGYREQVASAVTKAQLGRNVVFLGAPSLAEFEGYMRACDVVVSLRWPTSGESSGIMARAIGLGKLIITSDIPQFREFSEQFCWRVSYDTQVERGQLVKALLKAATQPGLLVTARQAALEYARDDAEWNVVGRRYADIIEQVAKTVSASSSGDTSAENPLRQVTGVNCIGDITAEVGLGTAARQMMETILDEGIAASFIERQFPSPARDERALELVRGLPTKPAYPTNLLFYNINDMHLLSNDEMRRLTEGKYLIARWFWELSQLSDEWIKRFSRVDEVWVSSVFTQQAMQAVTDKPITVIPATVEVPVSAGAVRAHFDLPEDRFIFFFSFAATSTAARKNPFAVIEAFEKAFGCPTSKGSPLLVIKAHHADDFPLLVDHLKDALARVGGILITKHYSRQEANDLLACADCYVSLHRAEGFGLGPAEAMYLGKPVIATNYSANVDFMTEENSYPVNYRERQIIADDHVYHEYGHLVYQVGMTWAEPDVTHAAELMRHIFEHPQEAAERGVRAASDIRALYSHEAVGRLIRKRLAQIERERPPMTKVLFGDDGEPDVTPQSWMNKSLQRHSEAIASLEWSRTRDKAMPLGKVKGLGTLPRILGRVLLQGRINERQQWINTHAHQEIRTLSEELTALKQQTGSLNEQLTILKQQTTRARVEQQALLSYMMRYGSVLGDVVAQAPELGAYSNFTLSEEAEGDIHTLVEALSIAELGGAPTMRGGSSQRAPGRAAQQNGVAWYHIASQSIASDEDRAEFFRQVYERLSDDDAFVYISSAEPTSPFDVGSLHVIYDGRVGRGWRATVVRRSQVERRHLVLGYDLYFSKDDPGFISNDIRDTGMWEPSETAFIRRYAKPGSVFVDIGANVGYFTALAAHMVGKSGRVIAVEPDPVSARVLRMNVDLLPHPDVVEVVHAAAGETPGWTRLYRSLSNHGDHRVFQVHEGDPLHDGGIPRGIGISVAMRRMDEILAHVPHVDFVKVDTQGFDFAALKSMESVLRRDHPILICEYWPSAMREAGYDPFAFRDMLLNLGYQLFQLSKHKLDVEPITLDEATVNSLPETGDLNIVAMPPHTHAGEPVHAGVTDLGLAQ